MLKRIRTVTRSTSVEVYDRAIAMTVGEHCLDFTTRLDSVCTVSVKNIHTKIFIQIFILNFNKIIAEHRLVTKKKKKKNEGKRYVCILINTQNIFQKRKMCDTCSDCEDINKYVA